MDRTLSLAIKSSSCSHVDGAKFTVLRIIDRFSRLLVVTMLSSCETPPKDCSKWWADAAYLREHGVIALNVDPAVAWSSLAREATNAGCPMMPPAMKP